MEIEEYLKNELSKVDPEEYYKATETVLKEIERIRSKVSTSAKDQTLRERLASAVREFNDLPGLTLKSLYTDESFFGERTNFLEVLNEINAQVEDGVIVDAGCGTGLDFCFLALEHPNTHFLGYDTSPRKASIARERLKKYNLSNAEIIIASHNEIPLESGSVGLIYFHNSFDEEGKFWPNYHASKVRSEIEKNRFGEIKRILKRNGLFSVNYVPGVGADALGRTFPRAETTQFAHYVCNTTGFNYEGLECLGIDYFLLFKNE